MLETGQHCRVLLLYFFFFYRVDWRRNAHARNHDDGEEAGPIFYHLRTNKLIDGLIGLMHSELNVDGNSNHLNLGALLQLVNVCNSVEQHLLNGAQDFSGLANSNPNDTVTPQRAHHKTKFDETCLVLTG